MALIDRVARLFRADLHAVLDRIEEPEQLLKQSIRDMEAALAATEQRSATVARDQAALAARRSELAESIAGFERQLDVCFTSGKDELAKGFIRRKLEAERLVKRLDARRAANEQYLVEQRAKLHDDGAALDSLRQKAELFSHRPASDPGPQADDGVWMSGEFDVGDDEVEVAYLREKSARSGS
jgi:phage shock protein A